MSSPRAINPVDPPPRDYKSQDDLVKFLANQVEQLNAALNTIQNRLAAGGL